MPVLLNVPVILLTAYAAWTDFKRKEIDNWVSAMIITYGTIVNAFFYPSRFTDSVIYMLIVFTLLAVIYTATKQGLGGGDIKLFSALAFYFGRNIIFLMLLASVIAVIWGMLKGYEEGSYLRTEVIFAPSIFIATVLTSFLPLFVV